MYQRRSSILLMIICLLQFLENVMCNQKKNDYEIKTLTGEPDYKSVNLTWIVDYVNESDDQITNSSTSSSSSSTLRLPKSFIVFYCELQSWGPHRCKSKNLQDNKIEEDSENSNTKQYSMIINNLRMATKYSFHVRSQQQNPVNDGGEQRKKPSGRADLNDQHTDDQTQQTIIIPTKGFSAHATKCLPHASEIEVETGPYFGGRIVTDGYDNCVIQGNAQSAQSIYIMRIDHNKCGSKVDDTTLSVETFITVQENLGILTHSTRRFLVVCNYQPDTLTVRASFSVPGKGGVTSSSSSSTSENTENESEREGRQRKFKMVGKNALILKEDYDDILSNSNYNSKNDKIGSITELLPDNLYIKNKLIAENLIKDDKNEDSKDDDDDNELKMIFRNAKYARLINDDDGQIRKEQRNSEKINAGYTGVIIGVSLSVIMIGAFMFVLRKESKKRGMINAR